jgi:tRNA(fMet)-specific endonuclease VapC
MTGNVCVLDTNIVVAILNGDQKVSQYLASFPTVCLPMPVIGELTFGALNSQRPAENLSRLQKFLDSSRALETTVQTARLYAEVRVTPKRKGRPIPENDIGIAASAVEHGLPLATRDTHFTLVDQLGLLSLP